MRREIWEVTASFSLDFYLSSQCGGNRDSPISHPLPLALGREQVENKLDKFSVKIAFKTTGLNLITSGACKDKNANNCAQESQI